MRWIGLTLFGSLGVLSRFAVDQLIQSFGQKWWPSLSFPIGTLLINVMGSFLAGGVYALGVERQLLTPELRLFLMVGFLGGFTTFSAYSLQTLGMFESGEAGLALLYGTLSPVLGLGAAWLAIFLARL